LIVTHITKYYAPHQFAVKSRLLPTIHEFLQLKSKLFKTTVTIEEKINQFFIPLSSACKDHLFPKLTPEKLFKLICGHLFQLHKEFGPHGDLKPETILLSDNLERVMFKDPVTISQGTVGYSVPRRRIISYSDEASIESACLTDLGAICAIITEMYGGNLGWDENLFREMSNSPSRYVFLTTNEKQNAFQQIKVIKDSDILIWVLCVLDVIYGGFINENFPKLGWCKNMLSKVQATHIDLGTQIQELSEEGKQFLATINLPTREPVKRRTCSTM